MGAVYRGLHLKMRKEVAIKVLHPATEGFPDLVARFEREAVAGAHVDHPNVASASDMGTFGDGSYFLVQELVRGRTLRDLIDAEAPLRPARAVRLARQLAAGLGAAHAHGIVHRDLKPLNVMVTHADAGEQIKLLDFGLARVPLERVGASLGDEREIERLSTPGVVFGSVSYMAPEIVAGMDSIDERSDLYSLGVILYELLAGRHPFDAGEAHEVLAHHRATPPPPFSERSPAARVPPALEALVLRLLAKDPAARYQSASELIEALDAGSPAEEPSMPRAFTTEQDRRGRRGAAAALGTAGAVAVAIGAAALVIHLRAPSDSALPAAPPSSSTDEASPGPSAAPPGPEDLGAALAKDLVRAAGAADVAEGSAVLVALADADNKALSSKDVRGAATVVGVLAAEAGGDVASQVYYALSYRFGADGLDVLYDIASQDKSQKAARRANAVIEIQATSGRASPALRVAVELRKAPCRQKPLLFSRVGSEGDGRALAVLEQMKPPACDPDGARCCFRHHVGLEKTIAAIRARVGE